MRIYRRILKHIAPLFLVAGISGSVSSACSDDDSLFKAPCFYHGSIEEICNNKDDNCDGQIDEDCDVDNDGYCAQGKRIEPTDLTVEKPYFMEEDFTCKESFASCIRAFELGNGYCSPILMDCDDSHPAVHPGVTEICNGIDDNCKEGRDETFPELYDFCYLNREGTIIPANEVRSTIGLCGPSRYICTAGNLLCDGLGYGEEICDNEDNDCDGIVDNNGAESETRSGCYYQWQQDVSGVWQKVNGFDDSELYGTPGVGICKTGFEICTTDCYDSDIPPPVSLECREDIDWGDQVCCHEGVIGGNQICYDVQFAQPEVGCNCLDENCDGTADEGMHSDYWMDFAMVTDCSGSMTAELGPVRNAFMRVHFPECFNEEQMRLNSIFVGDPVSAEPLLLHSLILGEEFRLSFSSDLDSLPASSCPSEEYTLDAAAYLACADSEMDAHPICQQLAEEKITPEGSFVEGSVLDYFLVGRDAWPESLPADWDEEHVSSHLHDLRREVWRGGAEHHLVLIADEKAQTRYSYLNQRVVGDLLREANISVDLYIVKEKHYNFLTQDETTVDFAGTPIIHEQGYGYLICQDHEDEEDGTSTCINPNGNAHDLDEEIAAGRLGRSIRQLLIEYYCGGNGGGDSVEDGGEESIEEGAGGD